MKKTYLQPSTKMECMEAENMICSSQDVTSPAGITYGGVDEDGTLDPASRSTHDLWEDDMADF